MSLRFTFFTIAVASTVVTITLLYNFGYVSFSERPGFTHIWGHVSYNGKPVPGCAIFFQPTDESRTHWGVGRMTDSGLYFITAFQLDYSLEPGPYIIFIRPLTPPPGSTDVFGTRLAGAGSTELTGKSSRSTPSAPQHPLPTRFTDAKTSGLVVNIDGEPQRIDIHLTD
jgi:hypothetical protein